MGGNHLFFFGDNESESRNTLYALVGTTYQKVYAQSLNVDRNTGKTAHGIYNEGDTFSLDYFCNLFDAVQQTGGRFAMHHRQVGDARILFQGFPGHFTCYYFGFAQRDQYIIDVIVIRDLRHAFPVGSIGQNQQFVVRAD